MSGGNLPFLKLKSWPMKIAVWRRENENGKGYWYSATIQRTFKDQNGQYQDTEYIRGDDFLKAAALLQEAHRRISIEDVEVSCKKSTAPGDSGYDEPGSDEIPF